MSCKALFCYIEVQLYDMVLLLLIPTPCTTESKPCKQGKLPLIFCFHQHGTVCVIHLSVHSIVDSEGVEYMYDAEGCKCVVQIIDRDQRGGVRMRGQHGVVRMKDLPSSH